MNYRFLIQYDGTQYEGWQRQTRTEQTIQGKIEKALAEVTGVSVPIIGAGRTDAGVHARGQVANARMETRLTLQELWQAVNEALPDDIFIAAVTEAGDRFHSRFSAKGKIYRYRIRTGAARNVFERRFIWQYGKPLDTAAMAEAADYLTGQHDFKSFCGNSHIKKSTVRTLSGIEMEKKNGELSIIYHGGGFLPAMARILTGTLVEVGEGKKKASDMPDILEARTREAAGFTAPPQGLVLEKVEY